MNNQKTIRQSCSLSGISLHHGLQARISFLPAGVNHGLAFEWQNQIIPVNPGSLYYSEGKYTTLANGAARVDCVEHVLAAVSGLRLTNLRIVLEGDNSPPWIDGSAWPFVQALLGAGLQDQSAPMLGFASVSRPLFLQPENNDSFIKVFPAADLTVDCAIKFDNIIGKQRCIFPFSTVNFLIDICRARSFLPYPINGNEQPTQKRLPGFRLAGADSNVIIYNEFNFLTDLRYSDEPVRHKILDFLGDMAVLGQALTGYVVLFKPCHMLNALLLKHLSTSAPHGHEPALAPAEQVLSGNLITTPLAASPRRQEVSQGRGEPGKY